MGSEMCIRDRLPRPKAFVWEVFEYLKITKSGSDRLVDMLNNQTWSSVYDLSPNVDDMTLEFHRIIDDLLNTCFEWKKTRRKSTDKPWLSDGVRKSIKKRAAIFRESGRCKRWHRLNKAIRKTLAFRKAEYNKNQKNKLEKAGKTGQWWSVAKFLGTDENPRGWTVLDLDTEKSAPQLASELAGHFTEITNNSDPLAIIDIPQVEKAGNTRYLDDREVAGRLRKMKKPASRIDGDLPVSYTHLTLPTNREV